MNTDGVLNTPNRKEEIFFLFKQKTGMEYCLMYQTTSWVSISGLHVFWSGCLGSYPGGAVSHWLYTYS